MMGPRTVIFNQTITDSGARRSPNKKESFTITMECVDLNYKKEPFKQSVSMEIHSNFMKLVRSLFTIKEHERLFSALE